jgi:hypothetical protein
LYLSPLSGDLMKIRHPGIGCMRTPENNRGVPPGMPWAGDCGLKVAVSSDPSDIDRYLRGLDSLDRAGHLFATAPDVLGDAEACWRRSAPLLPQIRALGYRVAFVAQDGFDPAAVDWNAFDCLFIGGAPLSGPRTMPTNERRRRVAMEWKRSERGGYAAIAEGKRRGKWVHVGRVNGGPFLRNVASAGADSADGTNLTWNNLRARTLGWLDRLVAQPPMRLEGIS